MTDYLKGFNKLSIDPQMLIDYTNLCIKAHITYKLGGKDPTPKTPEPPLDFSEIDCSGFVREAVMYATHDKVLLPDGSWNQWDYCKRLKFKESKFEYTGLNDGLVRICFKIANGAGDIGHVWLTHNGQSLESHGGKGVDRRVWDHPTLKKICQHVYVLG